MTTTTFETFSERCKRNSRVMKHYRRAKAQMDRSIERPCREGNCVEFFDPLTGKAESGWGPVGCPCEEYDPPNVKRAEYDRRRRTR